MIDTGKEANVSAEFTGVLFEDDCKAVVEGGNEIKTGTYTATIVGMIGEQSDNYVLHGEDTDYQIEYQIVKKERIQPIRRKHRQVLPERNQQELQCQENR